MIDLHTHTKFSDGTDSAEEVLKHAEKLHLDYLSITDHNTCKAYTEELDFINTKSIFSGKIIPGVELNTKVLGIPIEILGYGVNPQIINELTKKYYPSAEERNKIELSRIYKKCLEYNVKVPSTILEDYNATMFTSKYLHSILIKDIENKKIIDDEAWENSNIFYRKYMSNPESIFYVDMDDVLPDFNQARDIVKKAGGLLFIPHIFEYRDNALKILEFILNNYEIDGIECYYTTFTNEQNKYLIDLCKEKNLYMSGGSDYHGKAKPGVFVGIGTGNLQISAKIFDAWSHKIDFYKN